jgi:hypothetical protein
VRHAISEDLIDLAEERLRELRRVAPDERLSDADSRFEGNRFVLPGGFAVTQTGLIFHYDAFEIAPYALGPTKPDLPFAKVRHLLRA